MAKVLWLSWPAGGNLPPSLEIAKVLRARGHSITFVGNPEMTDRVEAEGLYAIELTTSYMQEECYEAQQAARRRLCYLTSTAVTEELRFVISREDPAIILVDAVFVAALIAVHGIACPVVVVCHTLLLRMLPEWRRHFLRLSAIREKAGFGALPTLRDLWFSNSGIIVTTSGKLDGASTILDEAAIWKKVHHVGPITSVGRPCPEIDVPSGWSKSKPRILVSFSTDPQQRSLSKLQRVLDALRPLQVDTIFSTSSVLVPEALAIPTNALISSYINHDQILPSISLIVAHGGHGTAMCALKHGVPQLIIPGDVFDQPFIGRTLESWGVARCIAREANAESIRSVVCEILADPSYGVRAEKLSRFIDGTHGAEHAARLVEQLINVKRIQGIWSNQ